jgi:antitoxin VapB
MGHLLTIESDEAFALATQLAALTGESLEAAITEAVRKKLQLERERLEWIARVRAITADIRADMTDPSMLDTDPLYDENGLPA